MKSDAAHANIRAAMRIFLSLLLLLPLTVTAADELRQREAELEALRSQIQAISAAVEKDQQTRDAIDQDLATVEKRLIALQKALRTAGADLRQAQTRADRLQAEQATLQAQLKQHQARLQQQMRRRYLLGRQANTRMMLSQDDPARLARLQVYLGYLHAQEKNQISAFLESLDAVQRKRQESQQALQQLQSLQQSHAQALQSIRQQRSRRTAMLLQVEQRLQSQDSSIARLTAQQAQLEDLIQNLREVLKKQAFKLPDIKLAEARGKLPRPAQGRLLARFNQVKPDGINRWKGVWIAADAGSPVRAIATAQVVYVGWMHHFGLLLVLDHGDGYFSLYGHNQSALRQVGDQVSAGEMIAEAGDTGGHHKSGVYLEIRKGRRALDPLKWLAPADA